MHKNLIVVEDVTAGNLEINGTLTVNGDIESNLMVMSVDAMIAVPNGELLAGTVQLMDEMGGPDASYACINHIGKIYRSQEPCVS